MHGISNFRIRLSQRKSSFWAFVASMVCALLAANQFWDSWHFHSKQLTPAENAGVRDRDFREAIMCVVIAIVCLTHAIYSWRESNKLERDWKIRIRDERFMRQFLRDVQTHPEMYREDFRRWIEVYHPEFAVWKRPPHSNN